MGLFPLWRRQEHTARATLAEVYGSFTDGFDSPDLREAATLLQALSAQTFCKQPRCKLQRVAIFRDAQVSLARPECVYISPHACSDGHFGK